jgi:Co/Zn/Cd efflux system component
MELSLVWDLRHTYSHDRLLAQARFEIIGAMANGCFLVAMSFLMMIEAVQRLLERSGPSTCRGRRTLLKPGHCLLSL